MEALGAQAYTAMQLMQIIGDRHVRLIPDVLVGNNGGNNGLVDGLLSMILWNQTGHQNGKQNNSTAPEISLASVMSSIEPPDGNSSAIIDFPLDKDKNSQGR